MPRYQITLLNRKLIAHNVMEYTFEKPDKLTFKSGQYGGFVINNMTRRFSFLSAPHDPHLKIAIRMQPSAYKETLAALPIDSTLTLVGPNGQFTLHETTEPAVLIAGGIGITPFYSMIYDAYYRHSPQQLLLFYGNESIEESAYFNELKELSKVYSNFKFIPILAHAEPTWQGERGWITGEIIQKYIPDLNVPIYYVCGALTMVQAVCGILQTLGIDKQHVKQEDFPGY